VQQCYREEGVNHYQNCREARAAARMLGDTPPLPVACSSHPFAQHVNAYLDCIKDSVGLHRINWN
jgi:hypothetical protein